MPGTGERSVRPATDADVKPLATIMARAFYDDPPFMWMLPDPGTRLKRERRFFAAMTRTALRDGGVDVALVGSQIAAAAIWRPPGHWSEVQLRTLAGLVRAFGRRISSLVALSHAVERPHPREPHWYLFAIGVDPALQGTGLASALLRSRLDQCDRAGLPAYLESSKPANVPLYQHFGFEPMGNPDMPPGAPQLTAMWRPPLAAPTAS